MHNACTNLESKHHWQKDKHWHGSYKVFIHNIHILVGVQHILGGVGAQPNWPHFSHARVERDHILGGGGAQHFSHAQVAREHFSHAGVERGHRVQLRQRLPGEEELLLPAIIDSAEVHIMYFQ